MMFDYDIVLECIFRGTTHEFHKGWESPVQLREGDVLYLSEDFPAVKVDEICWYLDEASHAFVSLRTIVIHDERECLYDRVAAVMDYAIPGINGEIGAKDGDDRTIRPSTQGTDSQP